VQTTLLGLAIALILALVSALVAPLVVDWNNYRSTFEAEASRLTGLSVHVNGTIDARILPTPRIKLRNVEVGQAGREPQMRAGTLELEVGLGPLLRGEVKASEVHLIAPQISLGLDRLGAIDWPAISPSFKPETLSISRLNIENGRVILTDAASSSRLVLQKLWFNGDIRSLVGPFKGEGAFVVGDELYGYRLSGNREGGGGLKIRFGVDPSDHPLTTDIDGTLTLDHGVPQFEGTLALSRPVGATLASGQRVMSEPWHAGGTIRATPASVSLQDFALQYGPDERAVNFTGKAELTFGAQPRLDGVVSALQLDVDRAIAAPDVTHQRPLIVIENFFAALVAAVKLPMPVQVGVGIDAVTIGGTTLQSLHGDVRLDGTGWSLDRFTFRAPGFTQVNLSGRLKETPQGVAFTGPAAVEAADVNMLLAWLEGRSNLPSGQAYTMSARGDLTIARDRLAVDRLTASLDQENVEGQLAYTWATDNRPAILNADLRAAELDIDALTTFAKSAVGDNGFELPHQVALALDIGKATFAGVDARTVKAQIKLDAGVLQIDRLSVGELGGSALSISGRIDELSSQPRGRVTLDLDARALGGWANVVGKFAPPAADILRRFADRLAPAKVHAVVNVDRAATAGSTAKLALDGQFGLLRVALNGDATGDPSHPAEAQVRIDSRLDADDGSALLALLGLDRFLAVDQLPGRATFSAVGPLNGDLRVDSQVTTSGFDTALRGTLHLNGSAVPYGTLQILASAGDLRPLHQIMTGQPGPAVPVSARAALAFDGNALSFTDLAVAVGKSSARGRLTLNLANPIGIDAAIEVDDLDGVGVSAMLLGLPAKAQGPGGPWSSEPIGTGAFTAMNGAVTFKIDRAIFTPALVATNLKGVAHFRPSEIAFDDLDGGLAGGHLAGALAFRRDVDGLAAHGRVELDDADAATVLAPGRNAVDGKLTMKLQWDGIGQSPAGLIGALHGSGTTTLTDGHFAAIDPAAFDAAIGATDQSGSIEVSKVRAVASVAMANGRLAVPHGDAALTITSGQVNLANVTLQGQDGAALSLNGVVDLGNAVIDARMTLSGRPPANALIRTRPELAITLKGPLAAPERALNASALTAWLTLRAAELQTRRLESIEANRRDGATGPVIRPESPAVRVAPLGAVVESAIPPNGPAALVPGARGFERLQPELPLARPNETRSDTGEIDHGGAPAITLPAPLAIKPLAPRPPRNTDGANSANAAAGAVEQNHRRTAPQPSGSQPAAPPPATHSPLDLLFRSQN
jgi:large subunit ribosomal protein L24